MFKYKLFAISKFGEEIYQRYRSVGCAEFITDKTFGQFVQSDNQGNEIGKESYVFLKETVHGILSVRKAQ